MGLFVTKLVTPVKKNIKGNNITSSLSDYTDLKFGMDIFKNCTASPMHRAYRAFC